tara:strand:- start:442 stop:741 length:300 start_codon:yes stop_codon:yes gene_type:complete
MQSSNLIICLLLVVLIIIFINPKDKKKSNFKEIQRYERPIDYSLHDKVNEVYERDSNIDEYIPPNFTNDIVDEELLKENFDDGYDLVPRPSDDIKSMLN